MAFKVNQDEWNGLSASERERIEAIIGGYFKGAKIVADPSAPRLRPAGAAPAGNFFCEAGCTALEAAAVAACALIPNPIAVAACVAVAHAAGEECRKKC